jgi:hypothetical protein
MANAAQNAPKFQIGKLSPEDAERLATSFHPAWELDDAPFAQGNGLSAADVDALAAGGVAPVIRPLDKPLIAAGVEVAAPDATTRTSAIAFELKNEVQPSPRVPSPAEPKVEIAVDVVVEPPQQQQQQQAPLVVEAQPQPAASTVPTRRVHAVPRPPPPAVKMRDVDSGEYVPAKKSNTGLIVGAVAVIAIVGGIFGVRALTSEAKPPATALTATASPTHQEAHIPPPPDNVAAQQPTQTSQAVAPVQTAQVAKPIETAAPTHTAVTNNAVAPVHTAAAVTHAATHAAAGGAPHHASIVRDNPF